VVSEIEGNTFSCLNVKQSLFVYEFRGSTNMAPRFLKMGNIITC
jgi:hypothetical protein